MALKLRICVRFATIFYVERVAVLTMTLSYVRIAVIVYIIINLIIIVFKHRKNVDGEDGKKVSHFLLQYKNLRQSLLSLHMTKSYVRTATRSTLKVEANLTQILNFKANFHTEFEPFLKKKIYANNGGHFKIVSIKIKN